jgi:methylmalonyl-CoA/ethylmalonyl-CoA epimerase
MLQPRPQPADQLLDDRLPRTGSDRGPACNSNRNSFRTKLFRFSTRGRQRQGRSQDSRCCGQRKQRSGQIARRYRPCHRPRRHRRHLETAVASYTKVFGMVERHREVNAEQGVAEAMLAPISAPKGSTQIQLLAPLTPQSTIARCSRLSPAASTGRARACSNLLTAYTTSTRSPRSGAAGAFGCFINPPSAAPTTPRSTSYIPPLVRPSYSNIQISETTHGHIRNHPGSNLRSPQR